MTHRIGIVGSSGGSALIAALNCMADAGYQFEPVIVVDRKCGLGDWANNRHKVFSFPYGSPERFSEHAQRVFRNEGCENVLLFYTRRVSAPLIDTLHVWNIHPALLPAFPGLHAVRQALLAGVSLFGATLHRVDAGFDTGQIFAQVATTLLPGTSECRAQRLSYIQKVWLTLLFFEEVIHPNEGRYPHYSSLPAISLSSRDLLDLELKEVFLEWLTLLESNYKEIP